MNKGIKKKGYLLVTYTMASAGRFNPTPELDDEIEVVKLTGCCCNGFFLKKDMILTLATIAE